MNLDNVTAELTRALSETPNDQIATVMCRSLLDLGLVDEAAIWLIDVALDRLQSLSGRTAVPLDDSPRARAFTHGEIASVGGVTYIPLRTDELILGVLELHGETSDGLIRAMQSVGAALMSRLLAAQVHSDFVHRIRGFGSLSLPATIQYSQTPPPAYRDASFEIGGKIEPAFDVAGDGFDYSVNGGVADFGLFDAVGHGIRATLLTTVALGAYRLHRRRGKNLSAIADAVDDAVAGVARDGEFVTGVLCRMSVDGELETANGGHLRPLRVGDGTGRPIVTRPSLPFGLGVGGRSVQRFQVAAGETIYVLSDGVIEAQNPVLEPFGRHRLERALAEESGTHGSVLQACRALISHVLAHVDSRLKDDVTIVGVKRSEAR